MTPPCIVVDACVLYPTVMREMVLGVARRGLCEPVWSARLLEEWARAAIKLGPTGEAQARAEIALLRRDWPGAERPTSPGTERRLWLPDPNDIHVLALAVDTSADLIMTLNAKDFPRAVLRDEGVDRVDPDTWLMRIWSDEPQAVVDVSESVLSTARAMSGQDWDLRGLLKKARLPRLAKALARA